MLKIFLFIFFYEVLCARQVIGISADEKCMEYIKLAKSFPPINRNSGTSQTPTEFGKVPTYAGEFPHMVQLGFERKQNISWACGGSLLSNQFVLTTAICASGNHKYPTKYVRVKGRDDEDIQTYNVAEAYIHPDFAERNNDIALLRLKESIPFTPYTYPACLSTSQYNGSEQLVATGWGAFDNTRKISDHLMKVNLDMYGNDECNEVYKAHINSDIITPNDICTGGKKEKRTTCTGDSGGPVQVLKDKESNVYSLVGVISFGPVVCGTLPDVNMRVHPYVSWIEKIVWK